MQARSPASASPRVTVVVTAHDAMPYVKQTIASIRAQDHAAWELLAVDDASTDGTGAALDEEAKRDTRIVVLRRERPGRSHALNLALSRASGEYVAVLDADDVAVAGRLRKQVEFLDAHPEVLAVGGAAHFLAGHRRTGVSTALPVDPRSVAQTLQRQNCLIHSAVMMRRRAVEGVGGYRPWCPPCEDYDLWLRLAERGPLANLPEVLVDYRVHRGQLSSTKLRRMSLLHLAVQRAASLRRAGRQEPTLPDGPDEPTLLDAFGISLAELERELVGQTLGRERLLRDLDLLTDANDLIESLLADRLATISRRRVASEAEWQHARAAWHAGDWRRLASSLASSLALAPVAQTVRVLRSVLEQARSKSAGLVGGSERRRT